MVLVVTACPAGLRGQLTRWLLEIAPGVFVGRVSRRVRELLWERVVELAKNGRAIMVFSAKNEQRLDFRVHEHEWEPVDFDGVHLMRRPSQQNNWQNRRFSQGVEWHAGAKRKNPEASQVEGEVSPLRAQGWSNVSRRRAAARRRAKVQRQRDAWPDHVSLSESEGDNF